MKDLSKVLSALYESPLTSTRTGATFAAHAYPTKVDPAAVALCVLAHTQPGDVVLDTFAGSGSSGIAAILCERPGEDLRRIAENRLGDVAWGPRDAVLVDLGKLPAFLARTLISNVDPVAFERAARQVLAELRSEFGWMYAATGPDGTHGELRHTVWSEHVRIDGVEQRVWDIAVSLDPPSLASTVPTARGNVPIGRLERVLDEVVDPLTGSTILTRRRTPSWVWGRTGTRLWRREVTGTDLDLLARIAALPVPGDVPVTPINGVVDRPWGEMYRAGYHQGLTHLHHFYTQRNLHLVAAARRAARRAAPELRDALALWVSSYDLAHGTLMTRVVVKRGAKDLVLTSGQPGALYVSALPVEKNIIAGLDGKIAAFTKAFSALHGRHSRVEVHCASALALPLPDASVDYVFTDPPFGDNIQYSEVNFLGEAWLGALTDAAEEVIVSTYQGKDVDRYRELLTGAFREIHRVLKPGRYATVVFHSAHSEVWEALRRAWTDAGLELVASSVLDKVQRSFKQTTTDGAVSKDPVVLLRRPASGENPRQSAGTAADPWSEISSRLKALPADDPQRSRDHLWAWLVRQSLASGHQPPMEASAFFAGLKARYGIERSVAE